ncbi:MAG: hypothetical protein RL722_1892 [Pseudomonadota bacterium]|jgi:signal transduction histidine kinase
MTSQDEPASGVPSPASELPAASGAGVGMSAADMGMAALAGLPGVVMRFIQIPGKRGRFDYVSPRAQAVLGVSARQLMQDALEGYGRVDQDDLSALIVQAADAVVTGRPLVAELRMARADAAPLRLRAHGNGRAADDGSVCWDLYLEALPAAASAPAQAAVEAGPPRSAARPGDVRVDLLARVHHELRNPLDAILTFVRLLADDPVEPPTDSQRARLTRIQDAADQLQGMLGDLLDLSHRDAMKASLWCEPVALDQVVRHCCDVLRPLADSLGVELLDGDLPVLKVHVDRLRLQQILLALLGNAIKFNRPQGWVRLQAGGQAETGEGWIELLDSGPGFGPMALAAAGLTLDGRDDPSLRRIAGAPQALSDASAVSLAGGLGIGLALSNLLADAMGGRLELANCPPYGAQVRLVLPLAPA